MNNALFGSPLSVGLELDEFGRNQLVALAQATTLSISRAVTLAVLLLFVAGALAIFVEIKNKQVLRLPVQVVVDALESVPIYLWVLAGVSWSPQSRDAITACIFVVAGLPLVYNSLAGRAAQIIKTSYFRSAIALGANDWHLIRYHLVPNLLPHALPFVFYVSGVAVAIFGGVGLFGFINRSELDLGVFLLRGKEQAGYDVTVLVLAMVSYVVVFLLIQFSISMARGRLLTQSNLLQ